MTKIINKTPHAVYILDDEGKVVRMFPKSQGMIRVEETVEIVSELEGIPLTRTTFSPAEDVPEYQHGTYYIVSRKVKQALPNRSDLIVPSLQVKGDDNFVVGCKAFDIS